MNGDEHEIKELVRQAIALGEENNVLLRKMRRSAQWASVLHVIYWIIIIGLSIGAFYFVEPYFAEAMSVWQRLGFSSSQESTTTMQTFESTLKNL